MSQRPVCTGRRCRSAVSCTARLSTSVRRDPGALYACTCVIASAHREASAVACAGDAVLLPQLTSATLLRTTATNASHPRIFSLYYFSLRREALPSAGADRLQRPQ